MSLELRSKWFDAASRPVVTPAGVAALCLGLWGCLAIYNATCHLLPAGHFAGRQLAWLAISGGVLVIVTACDTRILRRATAPAAIGVYLALWLVLFGGVCTHGTRGWFGWNGVFVQPSELAKPVFVLSLAWLMERNGTRTGLDWRRDYLPALSLCLLWILPIALQPDFGAVLVYVVTFAAVYWVMGGRLLHLAVSALAAAPVVWLVLVTHPYLNDRLAAFFAPRAYADTAGWHILQFEHSLAAGGLTGRSWGNSSWSQAHLPLGYSDSIFANTAEAVGFLGVLPLVLIVLAWVVYGMYRGARCHDLFSKTVVMGMVILLAGQAFIHFSVNLGLCPTTGITLPLISYGGSSLLASITAVGIVEAVGRPAPSQPALPADDCGASQARVD